MKIHEIVMAPLRIAGVMVKIVGRITIGIVGFVFMGAGLLLMSPFDLVIVGIPVFLIGLLLTVRAIF